MTLYVTSAHQGYLICRSIPNRQTHTEPCFRQNSVNLCNKSNKLADLSPIGHSSLDDDVHGGVGGRVPK